MLPFDKGMLNEHQKSLQIVNISSTRFWFLCTHFFRLFFGRHFLFYFLNGDWWLWLSVDFIKRNLLYFCLRQLQVRFCIFQVHVLCALVAFASPLDRRGWRIIAMPSTFRVLTTRWCQTDVQQMARYLSRQNCRLIFSTTFAATVRCHLFHFLTASFVCVCECFSVTWRFCTLQDVCHYHSIACE